MTDQKKMPKNLSDDSSEVNASTPDGKVEHVYTVKNMASDADTPAPRRKRGVFIGVCVAAGILIVAGIGLFIWHEQPSFCGAFCHTPMASYVESYETDPSVESTTLASLHRVEEHYDCLDCHVPTMDQQISEGMHWVSGDYEYDQVSERLVSRADEYDTVEFCLREGCHVDYQSADDLVNATANMAFNPHDWSQHGVAECGSCHSAHGEQTIACGSCHLQVAEELPEGWTLPQYATLPTPVASGEAAA